MSKDNKKRTEKRKKLKHINERCIENKTSLQFISIKGAAKLCSIYFSSEVIISFSTGLYKSAFSTHSFEKLGYYVSLFFLFLCFNVLNSM